MSVCSLRTYGWSDGVIAEPRRTSGWGTGLCILWKSWKIEMCQNFLNVFYLWNWNISNIWFFYWYNSHNIKFIILKLYSSAVFKSLTELSNHHFEIITAHFHPFPSPCQGKLYPWWSLPVPLFLLQPWANGNLLFISVDLPVLRILSQGVVQNVASSVWPLSLSMSSKSIHLIALQHSIPFPFCGVVRIPHTSFMWLLDGFCCWPLWIILLGTFMDKLLCEHMFSMLLGTYLVVELMITW